MSYSLHVASALAIAPFLLTAIARPSFTNLLHTFFISALTYYGALVCSIIVYRLSPAHALFDYPGPLLGKLTKLWDTYLAWTGKRYLHVCEMHKSYGDFVRTGSLKIFQRK